MSRKKNKNVAELKAAKNKAIQKRDAANATSKS